MASVLSLTMPSGIVVDEETASNTYAKFTASPFESGFGHTIGNALRRVLLSSLEGAAISAVRFDGTTHEFEKGLDVNVVYVLREVEAPEGYEKIADVEFFANEMEGTGITLLTEREDVVLTDAYKVALYEPHEAAVAVTERTEYRRGLVATGDVLPVAALAACACAALAVVVFAAVRRKRSRDGKGE